MAAGDLEVADFVGRTVGNWRLVRRLGHGGFGVVYEAENIAIAGRRTAVKILHPQLSAQVTLKQRFLNEASAASRADHENIVQIFDGGITVDGLCYSVMELLHGQTLGEVIRRGALDERRTRNIGGQIASALEAAHAIDIVHRDLKVDNVFVVARRGNPEFVKVLDFGVAKLRGFEAQAAHQSLTATGTFLGTPGYMSPEQWMTLPDIDGRADIYSLGMILFKCLAGRLPFGARSLYEWLTAHVNEPAPDVRTWSSASAELAELITRMVAKRREDRPQSMAEVVALLERPVPEPATVRTPTVDVDELSAMATVALPQVAMATVANELVVVPTENEVASPPSTLSQASGQLAARNLALPWRTVGRGVRAAVLGAALTGALVLATAGVVRVARRPAAKAVTPAPASVVQETAPVAKGTAPAAVAILHVEAKAVPAASAPMAKETAAAPASKEAATSKEAAATPKTTETPKETATAPKTAAAPKEEATSSKEEAAVPKATATPKEEAATTKETQPRRTALAAVAKPAAPAVKPPALLGWPAKAASTKAAPAKAPAAAPAKAPSLAAKHRPATAKPAGGGRNDDTIRDVDELPDSRAPEVAACATKIERAMADYVHGKYGSALATVEPCTGIDPRSWGIIGASACSLHNGAGVLRAYPHASERERQWIRYVCVRNMPEILNQLQ